MILGIAVRNNELIISGTDNIMSINLAFLEMPISLKNALRNYVKMDSYIKEKKDVVVYTKDIYENTFTHYLAEFGGDKYFQLVCNKFVQECNIFNSNKYGVSPYLILLQKNNLDMVICDIKIVDEIENKPMEVIDQLHKNQLIEWFKDNLYISSVRRDLESYWSPDICKQIQFAICKGKYLFNLFT